MTILSIADLEAKLQKYNTEDILSGIIEFQLMDIVEVNRLYNCEMLAGLLVKNELQLNNKKAKLRHFERLYEMADKEASKMTMQYLSESIEAANNGGNKKDLEKSFQMKIKQLYHRGDGYIHQILEFAQKLYGHFDKDISQVFGFSFTECKNIFLYIFQKYVKKSKSIANLSGNLARGGDRNPFIPSSYNYEYRISKEELYSVFGQEVVDNWIEYFNVSLGGNTNAQYNSLSDFNILYSKPVLAFDEYIYLILPVNSLQNLHKIFHYEFIANKTFSKEVRESYKQYRGDLLENLTADYMKRLFKNKDVFNSLFYFEDGHNLEEDYRFEADVTVQRDNVTLLCECKSKLLVLNSLKGQLESIESDVNAAIISANKQADRTHRYITERKEIYKRNKNGSFEKVYLKNTNEYVKICIVADHFGWIPSNISDYISSDNLPIVLNIFDLDLLTKETKDYREFLEYLISRRNHLGEFQSIDEFEIFCAFQEGRIPVESDKNTMYVFAENTEERDEKYYEAEYNWLLEYEFN